MLDPLSQPLWTIDARRHGLAGRHAATPAQHVASAPPPGVAAGRNRCSVPLSASSESSLSSGVSSVASSDTSLNLAASSFYGGGDGGGGDDDDQKLLDDVVAMLKDDDVDGKQKADPQSSSTGRISTPMWVTTEYQDSKDKNFSSWFSGHSRRHEFFAFVESLSLP